MYIYHAFAAYFASHLYKFVNRPIVYLKRQWYCCLVDRPFLCSKAVLAVDDLVDNVNILYNRQMLNKLYGPHHRYYKMLPITLN